MLHFIFSYAAYDLRETPTHGIYKHIQKCAQSSLGEQTNPMNPSRCSENLHLPSWAVPLAATSTMKTSTHRTDAIIVNAHGNPAHQRIRHNISSRTCTAARASCAGGQARLITSRWALEYLGVDVGVNKCLSADH